MNWQDQFETEMGTPEDEALEAQYWASAAEVDAVRRAQEAEAELRELRRAVVTAVGPFAMLEVLDGDVLVNDGVYINARDVARVRLLYGKCKDAADAP